MIHILACRPLGIVSGGGEGGESLYLIFMHGGSRTTMDPSEGGGGTGDTTVTGREKEANRGARRDRLGGREGSKAIVLPGWVKEECWVMNGVLECFTQVRAFLVG